MRALLVLLVLAACGDGTPGPARAMVECRRHVEARLRSPGTADHPMVSTGEAVEPRGTLRWLVRSYVDSQNGFGALVRTDYVCEVRYDPDSETWDLVDIDLTAR